MSPTIEIFLYGAKPFENVSATAFGKMKVLSSPKTGIFLYVGQPFERVLTKAFGTI